MLLENFACSILSARKFGNEHGVTPELYLGNDRCERSAEVGTDRKRICAVRLARQ